MAVSTADQNAETLAGSAADLTTILQGGTVAGRIGATKSDAALKTRDERIDEAGANLMAALHDVGIGAKKPRRKNNIAVVKTYDEAELVVEVVGCRTKGLDDTDPVNDGQWVSVLVKRGPRLSAERFAAVPRAYVHRGVLRLAAPREGAPWWRFQAYGQLLRNAVLHDLTMLIENFADAINAGHS